MISRNGHITYDHRSRNLERTRITWSHGSFESRVVHVREVDVGLSTEAVGIEQGLHVYLSNLFDTVRPNSKVCTDEDSIRKRLLWVPPNA